MTMCQRQEDSRISINNGIKLESNVKRWLSNVLVEETAKFMHI